MEQNLVTGGTKHADKIKRDHCYGYIERHKSEKALELFKQKPYALEKEEGINNKNDK